MSNIILNDQNARRTRDIERIEGVNGSCRNKLRSYRLFKPTYQVERYCSMHMSSSVHIDQPLQNVDVVLPLLRLKLVELKGCKNPNVSVHLIVV